MSSRTDEKTPNPKDLENSNNVLQIAEDNAPGTQRVGSSKSDLESKGSSTNLNSSETLNPGREIQNEIRNETVKTPSPQLDKRSNDKKLIQDPNEENTAISNTQSEPHHERILAVIIHRTDRIKSKMYIMHPVVKIHVVNASTGEYAKKSHKQRAVAYANETMMIRGDTVDYILPLMTKPSEFRNKDLPAPVWEELVLFNDVYEYFVEPTNHIMLMFEILDFKSMRAVKRDTDGLDGNKDISPINDNRLEGWHRIAWAFLKLVGSNGTLNIGKNLRLQLYKAPQTSKTRDEREPEVYYWWKHLAKVKYSGTLFVTVKPIDCPSNVPPSSRSMYAVQKEMVSESVTGQFLSTASLKEETPQDGHLKEQMQESPVTWSRLSGEPCKIPNKLWLTLTCGRGGCFRVKFSQNGRYLAGAGAEQKIYRYPIYLYGFPNEEYLGALFGHVQLIYELSWNSTNLLLSASADCTARIWDVNSMTCLHILTHTTFVYCARFHAADDSLVFTGSFDNHIRLWSTKIEANPKIIQEFEPHSSYVNCLCFTADNRFLYSGDGAGMLRIWGSAEESKENWMFLKELKEDRLMGKPINAIEVHPDQKRLFIQSRDGYIGSMEIRSFALRAHYRGLSNANTNIRGDLTPCGSFYFAGDGDGKAIVWNVQSTQKYAEYDKLSLAHCPVTSLSYHPFEHWVAFALYGPRQPILIYKYDSTVSPLHKEEKLDIKIEKPKVPAFDPDYSLAKLLEEHRLLTKLNLPQGEWSKHKQMPNILIGGQGNTKSSMIPSPSPDMSGVISKRVTFDDTIQHSQDDTSKQKNRQGTFAQRDIQQSTLVEIPLSDVPANSNDESSNDLEQSDAVNDAIGQKDVHQIRRENSNLNKATAGQQSPKESAPVQVRAKYNYKAQNDDEISFQKGDLITIVRREGLWWVGYVVPENIGYFPSNYVAEV